MLLALMPASTIGWHTPRSHTPPPHEWPQAPQLSDDEPRSAMQPASLLSEPASAIIPPAPPVPAPPPPPLAPPWPEPPPPVVPPSMPPATQTPCATLQVKPAGHGVPLVAHLVTPLLKFGL